MVWIDSGDMKSNRAVPVKVGNFVPGLRGPDFWKS